MANAIRMLAVDAVEKPKSGHPGAPMGMADIAEVLWNRHLKHSPANPHWADRDRFVLSNGHGSMLIYALLHLTGYALPMDDLRPSASCTAKPPVTPRWASPRGVGKPPPARWARASPTAWALPWPKKLLAQAFNRPDHSVVDHFTYVFGRRLHDGRHQPRGVCAGGHAAPVQTGGALHDDNGISIDGHGRLVHRRHAQTLPGLRLERHPPLSMGTTPRRWTRPSRLPRPRPHRPTASPP